MLSLGHRYLLEIQKDGETLARRPVSEDILHAAVECLQLEAVRRGALPPRLGGLRALAEPVWDPLAGEPYVRAVHVSVPARAGDPHGAAEAMAGEIPLSSFRELAVQASEALVEEGKLKKGELFGYRLAAFALTAGAQGPHGAGGQRGDLEVEEVPWEMPLLETLLAPFQERSSARGPAPGGEIPVFIPQAILEEVEALKEEAGAVETGGVLLGFLHRDPGHCAVGGGAAGAGAAGGREIFVEVTAQIHARHTLARSNRLTFTPETWSAVEDAIRLRGGGEVQVGFYHTHPAREWCKDCDPSRWEQCPLARPFYSSEDRSLHRTCYPRAFTIGLVAGDEPAGAGAWKVFHALYGWNSGALKERGFRVLDPRASCAGAATPRGSASSEEPPQEGAGRRGD